MDRKKMNELPKMQVGFIDFICMPLYQVCVWGGGGGCGCLCMYACNIWPIHFRCGLTAYKSING